MTDAATQHPGFVQVRDHEGHGPAREMIREVYATFDDVDGNFRQQFQTAGFDARIWELYLHACFVELGYVVTRPSPAPDFLLDRGASRIAAEATTANPSSGDRPRPAPDDPEAIVDYLRNELPIRLGSALYSKLKKRYWELPTVQGVPLVFAIESFASTDSLYFAETALVAYLFGIETSGVRLEDGALEVSQRELGHHQIGEKEVPSGFFNQPDAEHVSAVLFSNAGTVGKFSRMGFQKLGPWPQHRLLRAGWRLDPDPNADLPIWFVEEVGTRSERWSDELCVVHNPRAATPLHSEDFQGAMHHKLEDGQVITTGPTFHVFTSRTITLVSG